MSSDAGEWLNIVEAVKLTRKHENTIRRFIKRSVARDSNVGEYIRLDADGYRIDKTYLLNNLVSRPYKRILGSERVVSGDVALVEQLRSENEDLRRQRDKKDEQIADLNERLRESHVMLQHEKGMKLLGDGVELERKPWWRRSLKLV